MSQLAATMADTSTLGEYAGRDIARTTIAIQKTGDGLSESMSIDPQLLDIRSRVYVVLECDVKRHEFEPIEDTDLLNLKQVLVAQAATIVDEALVGEAIDKQKDRIKRAKDAATGQGSTSTALLENQHNEGKHRELVDGCPICESEREAEEEEQGQN